MDETLEDSLTKHVTSGIHDVPCAKPIPYIVLLTHVFVADQNIEGQQCFNGIPVCICLLVAGFVGAWNNKFPIRLTTAGQVTKSVLGDLNHRQLGHHTGHIPLE